MYSKSNQKYGHYGKIVRDRLERGFARRPDEVVKLNVSYYDVVEQVYPSELELSSLDLILVTGSAAGAYDKVPWVLTLIEELQQIYRTHNHIKLVGICFGHQIIAHALTNLQVIVNPKGWELGVYTVDLSQTVDLSPLSKRSQYRIQMVHQDIVVGEPTNGWKPIGCTDKCGIQGLYLKDKVLTFQGHFEFDRFITNETFKAINPENTDKFAVQDRINQDDDSEWVINCVVAFCLDAKV